MRRGTLRVYLGAAPGVGKTVAMLDEGHRRLDRGTRVAVAVADTHGRTHTAALLVGLPTIGEALELDVAAVRAHLPEVVLVDDIACHERWRGVQQLLDDGVHVVASLDVRHLESLREVITDITGTVEPDTIPDSLVRTAQVELVDMAPEALRRRVAHGNVYPAEHLDATHGDYFRIETLTALRELALLWVAGSTDDAPDRALPLHATETRERIVVAISGAGRDEELIRRAGRLAARSAGAQLHAVHVARSSRLSTDGSASTLERQPLVSTLGGTYHAVVGDSVAEAIAAFAHRVGATQIVVGQSGRGRFAALRRRGLADVLASHSGGVDVHVVPRPDSGAAQPRSLPPLERGLSWQRRALGLVIAAVLLPVLTVIATASGSRLGFAADVPLYLLVVVLTSLVGGIVTAIASALAASLLLNYYFTAPRHTFDINQASDVVAVVVFLLIALAVSRLVDVAARRADLAARAGAEAQALTTFATGLLRGEVALSDLLGRVRETFAMNGASLLQWDEATGQHGWRTVATDGESAPGDPDAADASADLGGGLVLAMRGHPLGGADQRVLSAVAGHVAIAYRQHELALAARDAGRAAEADRQRTALLNAVGHDLRTPIASAKIAVASLRATEVSWSPAQQGELLAGAEDALDRLTDLVTNLLDLSRLQAGALPVLPAPVGLGDVVARALDHVASAAHLDIDVPDDLPEIVADAGLLERVVANLVQNALRYAPNGTPVRVAGSAHRDHVQLRVIDRGPGIAPDAAGAAFRAFQRTDDLPTDGAGVGLGLAIARGFTEAMGGTVEVEQTPGGGATFVVTLRVVA